MTRRTVLGGTGHAGGDAVLTDDEGRSGISGGTWG